MTPTTIEELTELLTKVAAEADGYRGLSDINGMHVAIMANYRRIVTAQLAALAKVGLTITPFQPAEVQWGGLARQIMMALDMNAKKPTEMFRHLEMVGEEIPQWMRDEPEMKAPNHVPSKGTRVTLIYKAMLSASPFATKKDTTHD